MKAAVLKLKAQKMPTPLEREDQEAYFQWLYFVRYEGVRLWDLAYAIPNGGYMLVGTPAQRAMQGNAMARQGLKAGYPDVNIDIAVAPYHGLRIEFKRIGARKPDADQLMWHDRLRKQGYFVAVCYGLKEAQTITIAYFRLPQGV